MRVHPLLAGLAACTPALGEPTWALDRLQLEPVGADVLGEQSWSLYDARWEQRRSEARLICTALVELEGLPIAQSACARCTFAWAVTAALASTDCDDALLPELGLLTAITGVGIGEVAPLLVEDTPREGAHGGWIRYPEDLWRPHGWAGQPAFWRGDSDTARWDGELPSELRPAFAWELR